MEWANEIRYLYGPKKVRDPNRRNTMLLRWICAGFALWICSGIGAQDAEKKNSQSTDAKATLERVSEALKKTPMVSYRAEYKVSGWVTQFVPNMEGQIVVGQQSKHKLQRYYCQLKIQKAGSSEVREFTAGCDGENFFIIDPKTKTAHQDIDPGVIGADSWATMFVMIPEFGAPDALDKLIKTAKKVEIVGEKKVGEEDCLEIRIQADDPQDATWTVSKKDYLPRRITSVIEMGGKEASTDLMLHDFKVNPTFAKSPFELVVPEGYKKTDEFAP